MYKAAAALKTFFSGFDIPAYSEESVPDDVRLPYIAYSIGIPGWDRKASMFVKIWDRTTSNDQIIRIADQITAAIGTKGKNVSMPDGGYLVIWPQDDPIQINVDGDYRYAYINLWINVYNTPGA